MLQWQGEVRERRGEERRMRKRGGEEKKRTALIRSNNPHLAGEEQSEKNL